MVEDIWVHAARRLTSIEFSFDPCNICRDGPRGVGYPADARSVGDSHPALIVLIADSTLPIRYVTFMKLQAYDDDSLNGSLHVSIPIIKCVIF